MPAPDSLVFDGTANFDGDFYYDEIFDHRTREFESEFDLPEMRYRDASIVRRPDTVSPDYLTSFTVGPKDQGDVSTGVLDRVWRIRVVDKAVMISRADNSFSGV